MRRSSTFCIGILGFPVGNKLKKNLEAERREEGEEDRPYRPELEDLASATSLRMRLGHPPLATRTTVGNAKEALARVSSPSLVWPNSRP